MMVYLPNCIKLLMKYLKQTYISCTLKFPNQERCQEACGSQLYPVCTKRLYKNGDRRAGTQSRYSTMTIKYIQKSQQTRYIQSKSITIKNLQLNRYVTSYTNANKIQAAIIALDQEKAFDRVDWNFLFKVLQHFGHEPEIIQKIKTVHQNIEAQVKVNGHLSEAFLMKRGLRQGIPLSMILYIIFAEIFLENIRQNNGIKGTVIGEKELKTSAFADDATTYIGRNSSLAHLKMQLMHF